MIDKDEVAIDIITIILIPPYNHHDHWIPDEALDVVHQVLCEGERPHNEEQCNLDKCVYTDNPEIKANVDQDYMQTDPYLKVAIITKLGKQKSWRWWKPMPNVPPQQRLFFLEECFRTFLRRSVMAQVMFSRVFVFGSLW